VAAADVLDTLPARHAYMHHLCVAGHARTTHMPSLAVHATAGAREVGNRMAGKPVRSADMARPGRTGGSGGNRLHRREEGIAEPVLGLSRGCAIWSF